MLPSTTIMLQLCYLLGPEYNHLVIICLTCCQMLPVNHIFLDKCRTGQQLQLNYALST